MVLVGNDQGLIDMMARILKRGGYDVCGANGIKEAWTALAVCSPEAVVIERELPDGDGIVFCRALKRQGAPIKVLMVSVSADDEIPALHAGADDWMKKPYNIDVLKARIDAMLRAKEK